MPAPLDYVVLCGDADGEQEEAARQPLKPLRARRVERIDSRVNESKPDPVHQKDVGNHEQVRKP